MISPVWRCARRAFLGLCAGILMHSPALAEPVVFTGSGTNSYDAQGHSLSASATFEVSGSNLVVTLKNTYASRYDYDHGNGDKSQMVPSDVLTGLFFDVVGNPSLALVSAMVLSPNAILNPDTGAGDAEAPPTGPISGGWQYKYAATGTTLTGVSQHQGLGTSGFSSTTGSGPFNGNDVGNVDFGIVNPAYVNGDGNNGVSKNRMIRSAVVFTLSGLASGFNLNTGISQVRFQYGTHFDEPHFTGTPNTPSTTPEPSSLALTSVALIGLAVWQKRRKPGCR